MSFTGNEALIMIIGFLSLIGLVVYFSGVALRNRPVDLPKGVSQESWDKMKRDEEKRKKGW